MRARSHAQRACFRADLLELLLQELVHLAPLPGGGIGAADVDVPVALQQLEQEQQHERLDFLGPPLDAEVARGIAEGAAV